MADNDIFIIPDGPIFRAVRENPGARDLTDSDLRNGRMYRDKDGKRRTYSLGFAAGGGPEASHGLTGPASGSRLSDFDLLTYCAVCSLWVRGKYEFTAEELYAASPWELEGGMQDGRWEREASAALEKMSCAMVFADDPWGGDWQVQANILYVRVVRCRCADGSTKLFPGASITLMGGPFFLGEAGASGRGRGIAAERARELMSGAMPDGPFAALLGEAEPVRFE